MFAAFREFVLAKAEEEEKRKNEIYASTAFEADIQGCVLFGLLTLEESQQSGSLGVLNLTQLAEACRRLLIKNTSSRRVAAHAAANGCKAVFVPAFRKGERVTKRKRRRAVAAARRQLDFSCNRRPGRLSTSIRARQGKKLREVTQPRLRTFVGRRLTEGSVEGQRLGVRWRAR